MKKLTDRQKVIIAGVLLVLGIIHFAPNFLGIFHAVHATAGKPSPAHPMPVTPIEQAARAPLPPPPPYDRNYLGTWSGKAQMPDQSECTIAITLQESPTDPTKIAGHETRSCMPLQPLAGGSMARKNIPDIIKLRAPVYAEMTGAQSNGLMTFTVDQVVGTHDGECPLSAFSLMPFGPGRVLARWELGSCDKGQMVLMKGRG